MRGLLERGEFFEGSPVDMFRNPRLIAALLGFAVAQLLKVFTGAIKQRGHIDWRRAAQSGGMPSSHSSLCSALLVAVALHAGPGSDVFAVVFVINMVVLYDACHVRLEAGKHGAALNRIEAHLNLGPTGNRSQGQGVDGIDVEMGGAGALSRAREGAATPRGLFKEVLGHTPLEVLAGWGVGVVVGTAVHATAWGSS
ncbi:unnamed protein product [Pedinophyceae sp. YPF-701]|nr:unnamed protein product [Pedinophyceae sp. YPF-701]